MEQKIIEAMNATYHFKGREFNPAKKAGVLNLTAQPAGWGVVNITSKP